MSTAWIWYPANLSTVDVVGVPPLQELEAAKQSKSALNGQLQVRLDAAAAAHHSHQQVSLLNAAAVCLFQAVDVLLVCQSVSASITLAPRSIAYIFHRSASESMSIGSSCMYTTNECSHLPPTSTTAGGGHAARARCRPRRLL